MQIIETWGITRDRITTFFLAQDDVCPTGDCRFSYHACEISLTILPERALGLLRFPQTQIAFNGPEADTKEIHRRFVLQFLSAGG